MRCKGGGKLGIKRVLRRMRNEARKSRRAESPGAKMLRGGRFALAGASYWLLLLPLPLVGDSSG